MLDVYYWWQLTQLEEIWGTLWLTRFIFFLCKWKMVLISEPCEGRCDVSYLLTFTWTDVWDTQNMLWISQRITRSAALYRLLTNLTFGDFCKMLGNIWQDVNCYIYKYIWLWGWVALSPDVVTFDASSCCLLTRWLVLFFSPKGKRIWILLQK